MAQNSIGLEQPSVWKHMTKGYKCESTVRSVTHTNKDPADITRELKKDIHCLEKHYNSLKRKLQTHLIAFKPGENEFLFTSRNFNTVQVNERVVGQAAFNSHISTKEVTLELLHKDYLMGKDSTWHAHLDIHRMHHCAPKTGATKNKESSRKNSVPSSCQFPSFKPTSTKKLIYYPFPQKKNHLISEASRKLGLYE